MYARVETLEQQRPPAADDWLDEPVEIEIAPRHWLAVAGGVAALLAGLWLGGWLQVT